MLTKEIDEHAELSSEQKESEKEETELNVFAPGMLGRAREKKGWTLVVPLDIHWESWKTSPANKWRELQSQEEAELYKAINIKASWNYEYKSLQTPNEIAVVSSGI